MYVRGVKLCDHLFQLSTHAHCCFKRFLALFYFLASTPVMGFPALPWTMVAAPGPVILLYSPPAPPLSHPRGPRGTVIMTILSSHAHGFRKHESFSCSIHGAKEPHTRLQYACAEGRHTEMHGAICAWCNMHGAICAWCNMHGAICAWGNMHGAICACMEQRHTHDMHGAEAHTRTL